MVGVKADSVLAGGLRMLANQIAGALAPGLTLLPVVGNFDDAAPAIHLQCAQLGLDSASAAARGHGSLPFHGDAAEALEPAPSAAAGLVRIEFRQPGSPALVGYWKFFVSHESPRNERLQGAKHVRAWYGANEARV